MKHYRNNPVLATCLIPFLPCILIGFNYSLNKVNVIFKSLILLFIVIFFLEKIISKRISNIIYLLILQSIFLLISTLMNHGSIVKYINMISPVIILILIDYCYKSNMRKTINTLFAVFSILILINFIFIIMYPEGLYVDKIHLYDGIHIVKYNLIGLDNQMMSILIPALTITIIYNFINKKNILSIGYLMISIICVTIILSNSATSKLILCIYFIFFIIYKNNKRVYTLINIKNSVIGVALLFIAIVILRLQSVFSYIITDIFHKSLTISNRIFIWDEAFDMIKNNYLFGYGIRSTDSIIYLPLSHDYRNAHDTYLQLLLNGGIIHLIFFVILICLVVAKLQKYWNSLYSRILAIGIITFMISMIVEVYSLMFFYIILYFSFNIERLVTEQDVPKSNECIQYNINKKGLNGVI